MKNSIDKYIIALILGFFIVISCVEEIDFIQTNGTFESALVIEATITNELIQQKIILSRTYAVEEDGPNPESGATVRIESDQGIINFIEDEPGIYLSENVFAAQQNVNYKLLVTTSEGKTYTSPHVKLTQETEIDNLYATRINNDVGINGMGIFVDSFDPTNNSHYYRYTYEETYKIVAPRWVPKELLVIDESTCEVDLVDRVEEAEVCYNTVPSTDIILANTSNLAEDRVFNHQVRFIDSENFILSYRYSILVKQYVQSLEAYTFYKVLKSFSDEGNLFSQIQPGVVVGNMVSETDDLENVIGVFDVSTVSEKRLFFNYEDFYPEESIPDFPIVCEPTEHSQYAPNPAFCGLLISGLVRDRIVYYDGAAKIVDTTFFEDGTFIIDTITIGPFNMMLKPCGDCREYGTTEQPIFWED